MIVSTRYFKGICRTEESIQNHLCTIFFCSVQFSQSLFSVILCNTIVTFQERHNIYKEVVILVVRHFSQRFKMQFHNDKSTQVTLQTENVPGRSPELLGGACWG